MDMELEGRVIWITGLSGSGKTTLAKALMLLLPTPGLLMDGDELRDALAPLVGGYGPGERLNLARTYARLAKMAADQGLTVVCATISMFHEVQDWNRRHLPNYFEVFLDIPLEALRQRDYKKVYHKSPDLAEPKPVVGESIEPQLPRNPDLRLEDPYLPPADSAALIIKQLFPNQL